MLMQERTCSVKGCDRVLGRIGAGGLCNKHYQQRRREKRSGKCSIANCQNPIAVGQLCSPHYHRQRKHGDANIQIRRSPSEMLRWIHENVSHNGKDCLIWPFARHSQTGYPTSITFEGRRTSPNRIMCQLKRGKPPTAKHDAAHSCGKGSTGCIHPQHMSWKTSKENHADKILHGTTNRGERSPMAKISNRDVVAIRHDRRSDEAVGKAFGITRREVRKIRQGVRWSHIPLEPGYRPKDFREQKVSDAQVRAIYADPRHPTEIAVDYGVTRHYVADVKRGRTRYNVTGHKRLPK